MLPVAVHIAVSALALFMILWIHPRLSCLFYSAFEYAQAAIILSSLSAPARFIGVQHWLYQGYFSRFHVGMLCVMYSSAVVLPLQFFLAGVPLYLLSGVYAFFSLCFIFFTDRARVTGRDQKPHLPYNQFAALHEKQRRELASQRNHMQISGLLSCINLSGQMTEQAQDTAGRIQMENIYGKY